MDTKRLLSRFEGRIGRARYWMAMLIILGAMIATLLLLAVICLKAGIPTGPLNINIIGISASFQLNDNDAAAGLFPRIVTLLLTLVFAWFYASASIRRLHDRNRSAWWTIPFIGTMGLYTSFGDRLGGSWPAVAVGIAVFVVFLWGLAEMYFLKGTHGPNRFGRDPLAPLGAGPGWDQLREVEFVPHSAGPSPGEHVKRGHD